MYKKLIFTGLLMSSLLVGCSDKVEEKPVENGVEEKREEITELLASNKMTPEQYKELVTDDLKLVKLDTTKTEVLTGDLEVLLTGFTIKQSEISGFNLEIPTSSKNTTDKTYTVKISNFNIEGLNLTDFNVETEYVYDILPKQEKISSLSLDFFDFINDVPKPANNLLFTISVFEKGSETPLNTANIDLNLNISKEDKEIAEKINKQNEVLGKEMDKYNKENKDSDENLSEESEAEKETEEKSTEE